MNSRFFYLVKAIDTILIGYMNRVGVLGGGGWGKDEQKEHLTDFYSPWNTYREVKGDNGPEIGRDALVL